MSHCIIESALNVVDGRETVRRKSHGLGHHMVVFFCRWIIRSFSYIQDHPSFIETIHVISDELCNMRSPKILCTEPYR